MDIEEARKILAPWIKEASESDQSRYKYLQGDYKGHDLILYIPSKKQLGGCFELRYTAQPLGGENQELPIAQIYEAIFTLIAHVLGPDFFREIP